MLPSSDHSFHMHSALHGDCDMHALWQMSAFARSQKKKREKKAADMQVGSERLSSGPPVEDTSILGALMPCDFISRCSVQPV